MTLKVKKGEISFLSFLRLIVHYVQHLLDAPNVPGAGKSLSGFNSVLTIELLLQPSYTQILAGKKTPP